MAVEEVLCEPQVSGPLPTLERFSLGLGLMSFPGDRPRSALLVSPTGQEVL